MQITRDTLINAVRGMRCVGLKAEFEAEGSRRNEIACLRDIASAASIKLGVKIGGCEAVTDLRDAIELGADYVIAPMVETAYALQKYMAAITKYVSREDRDRIQFLFNVETFTTYANFKEILNTCCANIVQGVVIGRVDFVGSMNESRDSVNGTVMLSCASAITQMANAHGLTVVVGGGVSVDSLPFLEALPLGLARFETRKVIFDWADNYTAEDFREAVAFELLWLQYKQQQYSRIAAEDQARIQMLEERQRGQ